MIFLAHKRILWTEATINKRIKEGRGQGKSADYIPWIKVGEFSSRGRAHRIPDVKTGRIHHLFSDLEADYYYYLMWSDEVVDIREQFPLFPVSSTERIAQELHVKYPKDKYNDTSIVMTTDFLITIEQNGVQKHYARSVKFNAELAKTRVCEKQILEKYYWQERGIPWAIITENSFSRPAAKNICKLLGYYNWTYSDMAPTEYRDLQQVLINRLIREESLTISDICTSCDIHAGITPGSTLNLFWHMASRKIFPINVNETLLPNRSVRDLIDVSLLKSQANLLEERNNEYFA